MVGIAGVIAVLTALLVAIVAGVTGWFMVLRKQTFAGHTLAVSAFPGAAAATLLGVSATAGYFTFALAAAVVIAIASRPSRAQGFSEESAVVGALQAFVLACGYLFVYLYKGFLNSVNGPLFGSSFAITNGDVVTLDLTPVPLLALTCGLCSENTPRVTSPRAPSDRSSPSVASHM